MLTDGKAGDRVQCVGVAEHLGLVIDERVVRPRRPWSWFAPHGQPDPREALGRSGGPLRLPAADIVIASGRRTVPHLRVLTRRAPDVFTVFLKDPRVGADAADLVWVPQHDTLRGSNVVVTLTSPSQVTPAKLEACRRAPDPRLAALPAPRVAMVLGGPNARSRFDAAVMARLRDCASRILADGWSLMITPSRRTPTALVERLAALAGEPGLAERVFLWDGEGANPYLDMLALADALIVTADSANMLSEATLTGAPVHVFEPDGGHPKLRRFVDGLIAHGAARRWTGRIEAFTYQPLDATPIIAAAIEDRYSAWRLKGRRSKVD